MNPMNQAQRQSRYMLPGEEPMTWRERANVAGRVIVYALILAFCVGVVGIFAYSVAGMVGYP